MIWVFPALFGGGGVLGLVLALGGRPSLPGLFMGLAGVALLSGLAALFQSLRTAFGGGPDQEATIGAELGKRTALLEEKKALLRAIKDIAFEREVGKISEEDFQRLDRGYRRRAKEVLRLLDQDLGRFLSDADRLVAKAMSEGKPSKAARSRGKPKRGAKGKAQRRAPDVVECPACHVENDPDATFCKACSARIAPLVCAACETENDPDAKFCKRCAKSLVDQPESEPEESNSSAAEDVSRAAPHDEEE